MVRLIKYNDGETYVGTQPIFVINNNDDQLIKIDKNAPAIISHIGKNSVSGPGVFTQNIPDIGPIWNEDGTLIGYLEHMIRNNPHQFKNNELDRVIEIISYLDAPSTNYTRRRQFIANGAISRIRRPGLQVQETSVHWSDPLVKGTIEPYVLNEYLKNGAPNNEKISSIYFATFGFQDRNSMDILKTYANMFLSAGSKIVDNRAFYFKGLCNIYARARLEMHGGCIAVPAINNQNSGLVYINTAAINDAAAQNMLFHAQQQSFAFFYNRNSSEVRRTLLEIIGYEGMAFQLLPQLGTTPWQNLIIERINIVYFAPIQINDHVIMPHASEQLLGALIDIAIERHEISDFMAGFQHAMELMPASLYRHTRLANAGAAPAPAAQQPDNDDGGIVNDDNIFNLNGDDPALNPNAQPINPDEFRYPYLDDHIAILPADAPARDAFLIRGRPRHVNADHPTYVGDKNYAGGNTHRVVDWLFIPLDAYNQYQPNNLSRPLGDNWFYNLLSARKPITTERLPPFLYACKRDLLVYVMCFGFTIINAAATSVNIAYNITGSQLDAFNRSRGVPAFAQFYRMFMTCASSDIYMQAPYFAFVGHVVELMTGHKMFSRAIMRTFNRDLTYCQFGDRYGVYHYLTGNLPVRSVTVLCIDNFIKARPREWGLFAPDVSASLHDCLDYRNDEPNILQLITHLGTNDWFKLWKQPVNRQITQTFCALLLNTVSQSQFAGMLASRPRLVYWYTSATLLAPNVSWRPSTIEEYPPPLFIDTINIIEPGTLVGFDWNRGYYLAPSLVINGPAIPRLLSTRTMPDHKFDGAGIILRRVNETWQYAVFDQPNAELASWQIQQADRYDNPPDVFYIGQGGYANAPSCGSTTARGDKVAITSQDSVSLARVDVNSDGDAIVNVQLATINAPSNVGAAPASAIDGNATTSATGKTAPAPATDA